MNGRAEVEKEFNVLTHKIAQLESFRHELDSLDTKGFDTEAKLIRSQLHDVNAIPTVSHELVELRKKIKERHAEKENFEKASTAHRTKTQDLERYQKALEKKIAGLEHSLKTKDEQLHHHLQEDVHHKPDDSRIEHYKKLLGNKIARLQQAIKEKDIRIHDHLSADERLHEQDQSSHQSASRTEHYQK